MVFPLVANCSSLAQGIAQSGRPSLHSSLDTGPADSQSPRCGTKPARAWLENHRPRDAAAKFRLFAVALFQARFAPGEEARSLRVYFASATIVFTDAVTPPPTSISTM